MTKFREPIKGKDPDFKIMPSRAENFWVDRFEQIKSINPNFEMTTDDENMRKSSIINLKCKTCGNTNQIKFNSLLLTPNRKCIYCEKN